MFYRYANLCMDQTSFIFITTQLLYNLRCLYALMHEPNIFKIKCKVSVIAHPYVRERNVFFVSQQK